MAVMEEILETLQRIEKKIDNKPVAAGEGLAEPANLEEGDNATWDVKELAEILDVSPPTIYEHTRQGRIPHLRMGTKILYPKAAIYEWLLEEPKKNYVREKELDHDNVQLIN